MTELLLIVVLALIFVGPKQLPTVIKTTAKTMLKAKQYIQQIRQTIEKEIDIDDLKTDVHNDKVMAELKKAETNQTIHNDKK